MAKLRISGDSSGYVDLEAPNAASSSTLDLDQVPQKNAANVFTTGQTIQNDNAYFAGNLTESSNAAIALRVTPTRAGQTKGISLGSIGKNGGSSTGIQAYDTSDNSSNTLELNPHGGAVTTPQQPCVWVTGIGGSYITMNNELLLFTVINHQTGGSNYNTSTKLFTCPVAGWYEASCHLITAVSQSSELQLHKNGTTIARQFMAAERGMNAHNVVYCAANDTLGWHYSAGGTVYYDGGSQVYSSALYRLVG